MTIERSGRRTILGGVMALCCGCDRIAVPARDFDFVATVASGSETVNITGHFSCHFVRNWGTDIGPSWILERKGGFLGGSKESLDPFELALKGPPVVEALQFEIHPARLSLEAPRFPVCEEESAGPVPAVIFYRRSGEKVFHSIASGESDSGSPIRVLDSSVALIGSGRSLFWSPSTRISTSATSVYYSVFCYIFSSSDIDRSGLRDYVREAAGIALPNASGTMPFDRLAAEIVMGAGEHSRGRYNVKIQHQIRSVPYAATPSMTHGAEGWHFASVRDWEPVPDVNLINVDASLPNAGPITTTNVTYKGRQIEVPILLTRFRPIYDSERDELVVFTNVFYSLAAN